MFSRQRVMNPVETEDFPEGLGLVIDTTGREAIENYLPNPSGELHDLIRRFGFVILSTIEGVDRTQIEPTRRGNQFSLFHVDSRDAYVSGLRAGKTLRELPTLFVSGNEAVGILKEHTQDRAELTENLWRRLVEESHIFHQTMMMRHHSSLLEEEEDQGDATKANEIADKLLAQAQLIRSRAKTLTEVNWREFPQGLLLYGRREFDFKRGKLLHGCFPATGSIPNLNTGGELQLLRFQRNWFLTK